MTEQKKGVTTHDAKLRVLTRGAGFTYTVSREQIDEYRKWPLDRRLKWLFYANKMRRLLPKKTIEVQEAFHQEKI